MTELPNDIEQLKAMLIKLQEDNQVKSEQLQAKDKIIQSVTEEKIELENKVQLFIKQLNLNKSKRFSSQREKVVKGTFNEAEQQNSHQKLEPKHHKEGRKPLPKELEREVIPQKV